MRNILLIVITMLVATHVHAFGADDDNIPDKPYAWVNDYPNLLRANEEMKLNKKLMAYQDSTSTQIFIVLMNEHGMVPVNMMATEIGEKWNVGQKGKDNGVIILLYPNDHKVSIQVGYGLEQYIPDAIAKRIIENEMLPAFRQNNYFEGLNKGTTVIMNLLSGKFTAAQYRKQTASGGAPFGFLIFLVLFFIFFGNSRRRRYSSVGRGLPFWLALSMMSGSRNTHYGSWGNFSGGSG
ncbi:MAG TPA: TPM domain-containing protein, partial [Bacteroidales bacterium]|nr:TPM domain-containing protein [Bacteroidales bacterium]